MGKLACPCDVHSSSLRCLREARCSLRVILAARSASVVDFAVFCGVIACLLLCSAAAPPDGRRTNGRQQDTCSPFSPAVFDFVRRSCFSLPPLSVSLGACRPGFQGDDDCVLYRDADGRRHRDGLPVFRAVNKGRHQAERGQLYSDITILLSLPRYIRT